MQITIKEKKENPLLDRTEVQGEIKYDSATPSNQDIATALAKELKTETNLVVMKNIYSQFGQHTAKLSAFIYKNKEAKDKYEIVTKHMKKQVEEAKKKATEATKAKEEKKAEEKPKKEEKPAEEVKEEPKQEEVKEKPTEEKKEEAPKEEKPVEEVKEEPKQEEAKEKPTEEVKEEKKSEEKKEGEQ